MANFSKIVNHLEEPVASPSALALWDLVHFAKKDVTVVLAGQGSDEPWGGYRRYQLRLYRGICCPIHCGRRGRYLSLLDDVSEKVQIPYWAQRAVSSVPIEEQVKDL